MIGAGLPEPEEELRRYSLRFLPRARDEARSAALRLADLAGAEIATAWTDVLETEVAKLATNPRRCPIIPESRHFKREVRHLVFHRATSALAYRVLFVVEDDTADGPLVTVIHVRHAAARPITKAQAGKLSPD